MTLPGMKPEQNSLAQAFISRTGSISPAVLRLGGGDSHTLTISQLEIAIVTDPEFTLRALSLANSAFYSQRYEITSLRGALVVLGVDVVHNLAANLLAQTLLASPVSMNDRLWDHCQAVGVAAQLLSEAHQHVDPKQAFAAGLLHDIGMLALQTLGYEDNESLIDHASLGGDIAEQLGLADSLALAIRHHDGRPGDESASSALQATVYLANALAEQCGFGIDVDSHQDPELIAQYSEGLELTEDDLEVLANTLPARLANHRATLGGGRA